MTGVLVQKIFDVNFMVPLRLRLIGLNRLDRVERSLPYMCDGVITLLTPSSFPRSGRAPLWLTGRVGPSACRVPPGRQAKTFNSPNKRMRYVSENFNAVETSGRYHKKFHALSYIKESHEWRWRQRRRQRKIYMITTYKRRKSRIDPNQ